MKWRRLQIHVGQTVKGHPREREVRLSCPRANVGGQRGDTYEKAVIHFIVRIAIPLPPVLDGPSVRSDSGLDPEFFPQLAPQAIL